MSIKFRKPERHADLVTAVRETVILLLSASGATSPDGFAKFLPRAYGHSEKIAAALKGKEEADPDNLAWKWLSLTLSEATAQFLDLLRRKTILLAADLEEAVKAFITAAMNLPDAARFDAATILHTSTNQTFQPARAALQPLVHAVTLWTRFDMAQLQNDFDRCLHAASAHVFASNHGAPRIFVALSVQDQFGGL